MYDRANSCCDSPLSNFFGFCSGFYFVCSIPITDFGFKNADFTCRTMVRFSHTSPMLKQCNALFSWGGAHITKAYQRPAVKRILTNGYSLFAILFIMWFGHEHPVSRHVFVNLSYHLVALVATALLWGILVYIGDAIISKLFKRPPSWLLFSYLFLALFAACIVRVKVDLSLEKRAGIDGTMIESPEGGMP